MSKTPSITEQELKRLKPTGLDEAFLSRLTACADDHYTDVSEDEAAFAKELQQVRPRGIKTSLMDDLVARIGDTPFAMDEKIVLFNKPSSRGSESAERSTVSKVFRMNLAAAAAVALLGSLAALVLPGSSTTQSPAASSETSGQSDFIPLPTTSAVAPIGYNRTLVGTSDEGVVWRTETEPYRVLRHTYTDRITTEQVDGETIRQEQPHVEYSLVPEKVD